MRKLTEIIIHCTTTGPEWMAEHSLAAKRDEIRRWHVEGNGWRDIGYHFLIDRDGSIIEGRPIIQIGAHTRSHNKHSIGIALIGEHGGAETDQFFDHFTEAQDEALRGLISNLRAQHGSLKLSGHNQYAAKACPCFKVSAWLIKPKPKPTPQPSLLTRLITAILNLLKRSEK